MASQGHGRVAIFKVGRHELCVKLGNGLAGVIQPVYGLPRVRVESQGLPNNEVVYYTVLRENTRQPLLFAPEKHGQKIPSSSSRQSWPLRIVPPLLQRRCIPPCCRRGRR